MEDVRLTDVAAPSARKRRALAWLTGFVLANVALAIVITATNIPFAQTRWEGRSVLFLLTALPGHFIFFGALLGLPALMLGRMLRSERWMIASAVVLQAFWICLLLSDAKVFALVPLPPQCHGAEHAVRWRPAGPGHFLARDVGADRDVGGPAAGDWK
jgi:hypothetical protein